MGEIAGQLNGVWSAVAAVAGGSGAAVLFIGARREDPVSECSRAFARLAAGRASKPVWLLDLDLFGGRQFEANGGGPDWQGPFDMTFGRTPFWRAGPRTADGHAGESALVSFRAPGSQLYVSRFRREALAPGQTVQVAPSPDYWAAVRANIEVTVVDAPPLERSRAGLAIASDMDGVVLIVDADRGDARDALEMREEVANRGGRCLGVIVVRKGRARRLLAGAA